VAVLLLAIYAANAVLVGRVKPPGAVDKSGLHCLCRGEARAPQVVFHHSEVGSALEWGWLMEQLAGKNVSSCACDRPGYGFSAVDAPEVLPYRKAPVVVAKSLGAVYALKQAKAAKEMVLLDPLVGEVVNDDWSAYRSWLNRPLDNDRLLVRSGFARLLRVLGTWQPWYGPQPSEWDLQLIVSHSDKIRAVMSGEMFAVLRNNTRLPKLKKSTKLHVFFANDKTLPVRVDTRRRAKAALTNEYEEHVEFTVLPEATHRGLVASPVVLEHIVARAAL